MIKMKLTALAVSALLCAATLAMAQTSDPSRPAESAGTVTNGSTPVMPAPREPRAAAPGTMSTSDQQRTGVPPTAGTVANAPAPGTPGATGLPTTPK